MPDPKVLGTFKLVSSVLRVTDPCYNKGTWCAGTIPALSGEWKAAALYQDEGDWGTRVKELLVWHTEKGDQRLAQKAAEEADIDVGVDSGQAGFFDEKLYPEDPHKDASFYDSICKITSEETQGGVIEFGAVSRSGFGDGSYTCYLARDKQDRAIAARIDYIPDQDESEDTDES